MIPSKVYILKTDNKYSIEYAKTASISCDNLDTSWEYVEWYSQGSQQAWKSIGIPIKGIENYRPKNDKAQLATSGHAMIWKKILDSGEAGIVFEHDSILLHKVDIDIPDNTIVVLGYKTPHPERYDHEKAGPPKELLKLDRHEGAHAYAITPKTAELLLDELKNDGIKGAIDNTHFLKSRKTKVPLMIMSPTPAIGWLRESTIWKRSADKNYEFIESFKGHYKK